jgi:hypothetical protein
MKSEVVSKNDENFTNVENRTRANLLGEIKLHPTPFRSTQDEDI